MKRSHELLNPPAAVKLALGELIVKFARLTLRRPLSLRSSLELGTLFCEVLNDKTTTPRMTHGTLVDVSDACEQLNINANGFKCLSKAILEDAEPSLKVSDDDLAQNPDLLERLADAVFKVKKNGLESVFTPGLEKKMTEAGYNVIGGLLSEEEERLDEEYIFHTSPSFIHPEVTQFEQYLLAQFTCFRIPRRRMEADLDVLANIIISVALLVKAMDSAKLIPELMRDFDERDVKYLPNELKKLVSSRHMRLESKLKDDLEFFIKYNLETPDVLNYSESPHSSICTALKVFVRSEQNASDVIKFVEEIMPFLGVIRDFLNDAQVKEETINSEKMHELQAAKIIAKKGSFKEASEKFKGLLSFFKSTESQNVTRQIMLGETLMNMALCKERQNEPLQSMIFYLRAQSVFGGLINIEDSKQRYQECDKKILELEGTIEASMSTCKREV